LWTFYLPLIATTLIRQATRPVLNAGIAAAAFPLASLAAWPVTSEFVILITGPAWSLQQLTTALADSELSFRRVVRFALGVSVMFSVLLGLVAFSPIYGLVMGGVFNLSSALQNLAKPALQVIVILPLLLGAQAVLRGALIRRGRTSAVRTATMVSMLTLFATVLIGVKATSATGVMLAAFATLLGSIGELAWLLRERRR
jgi:Na+-driven multidrug efflux pump